MENNGKGKTIIIVLLLILVIILSSYIVYDKFISKKETDSNVCNIENNKKEKESLLKNKNKNIVYDLVNKNVKTLDKNEAMLSLPYVNIDSEYAKEINNEISKIKKEKENKLLSGHYVTYTYSINGSIVSIFIEIVGEGDYNDYYTYNIDKYTGEHVSEYQILKYKKVTKEEIIDKLDKHIKEKFDEIDKVDGTIGPELKKAYNDSLEYNKGAMGYPMYINANKELIVMSYYKSIAGGTEAHAYMFNIDKNKEKPNEFDE